MTRKHLRTIALAGTFVLGTAGLGFAAGSGSGSAGSGMNSGSSSNMNSNSTNMGSTKNEPSSTTGLENAETRGGATGRMEKQKHGKAFQREDSNTTEKNELNRSRK